MELLDVSLMAVSERLERMGRIIENLCGFPFQCFFIYAGQLFLILAN